VETIQTQLARTREKFDTRPTDLDKHVFLRSLQDTNEVLFFRFLRENLTEMLPVVYTPVVGTACQEFSHIYRRPHGIFLSYEDRNHIGEILATAPPKTQVIVATDGERILGLGDQGLGGMGIPIGKLSLYTAFAGFDPTRTLPVLLDVGTNNPELLDDPLYMGCRHERIDEAEYDEFLELFVSAVTEQLPGALLQWEDFAQHNATRLLNRYRDRLLSFNDDIQGTAAITLAALLAACRVSGRPFSEQRVCIVGAGSAGTGIGGQIVRALITAGLSETEATSRVHLLDRRGLLHDGRDDLETYQAPFAQPWSDVAPWATGGEISLDALVDHSPPTALIGVSGATGVFTERVVRGVAAATPRPIIFPLSNPNSHAEARPDDLIEWTDGSALVATGSPFPDVEYGGRSYAIAQANNVYIFPGLGLGAVASGASRVSDAMLTVAAQTVAEESISSDAETGQSLLPPLERTRALSTKIAIRVAERAIGDGDAPEADQASVEAAIEALRWEPEYREYAAG